MPRQDQRESAVTDPPRGREAVEQRLIEASADLLASVGPRQLSMRDVSRTAGVNVAQAYHYFGSKDALMTAAMRHLAQEWYDHMAVDAGHQRHPSPLPISDHPRYWRALCHAMLDGEDELARLELSEDISVARKVIESAEKGTGGDLSAEARASLAAAFTLSLGWVAFESFMLDLVELPHGHSDRQRTLEQIELLCAELVERAIGAGPSGSRDGPS